MGTVCVSLPTCGLVTATASQSWRWYGNAGSGVRSWALSPFQESVLGQQWPVLLYQLPTGGTALHG